MKIGVIVVVSLSDSKIQQCVSMLICPWFAGIPSLSVGGYIEILKKVVPIYGEFVEVKE